MFTSYNNKYNNNIHPINYNNINILPNIIKN